MLTPKKFLAILGQGNYENLTFDPVVGPILRKANFSQTNADHLSPVSKTSSPSAVFCGRITIPGGIIEYRIVFSIGKMNLSRTLGKPYALVQQPVSESKPIVDG